MSMFCLSKQAVHKLIHWTLMLCGLCLHGEPSPALAIDPAIRDIEYAVVGTTALKLDLYLADNDPARAKPWMVWVHGGAWRSGSKSDVPIAAMQSMGFAIASVDYRLSPVAPFPAQIHDIKAAIRFLRANHQRYRLDPDRAVIAGASAGGHLAALVGVSDGVKELDGDIGDHLTVSSRAQAIVSFYGAANLQTILSQSTPFGLNMRVPALELLLGGQPEAKPELARLASPVEHVDRLDPPLWLYHGDQDPQMPINQAHELHGAYKRVQRPVQFEVIHNAKHGGREFFEESRLRKLSDDLLRELNVHPAHGPAKETSQSPKSAPSLRAVGQQSDAGLRALTYQLTVEQFNELPSINRFRETPSDQFLIDWQDLRTGHPYLGTASAKPHTGAHLYFKHQARQFDPTRPEQYPPIYAVADGIVTRVDEAFLLRPVYFPNIDQTRANLRYGLDITFAKAGDHPVSFHYSIEPMVHPGEIDFYKPFLKVAVGQRVRKGDVIATMYLPPDPRDADNAHIHFNLMCNRNFQSPSIFQANVEQAFAATWDATRLRGDWPIPPCMGWKLGEVENPFAGGR